MGAIIIVKDGTNFQEVAYNTSKFNDEDLLRRDVETRLLMIFRIVEPRDFIFRQYVQPM